MVRNAVHNTFLNTLTKGTAFPRVPLEINPRPLWLRTADGEQVLSSVGDGRRQTDASVQRCDSVHRATSASALRQSGHRRFGSHRDPPLLAFDHVVARRCRSCRRRDRRHPVAATLSAEVRRSVARPVK